MPPGDVRKIPGICWRVMQFAYQWLIFAQDWWVRNGLSLLNKGFVVILLLIIFSESMHCEFTAVSTDLISIFLFTTLFLFFAVRWQKKSV